MSRRTMTLIALALTLSGTSACDEAPEAAFGADGEVALRPGSFGSGILLNTSASGEWAIDHLDTNFGTELDGVSLEKVIVQGKEKGMDVALEAVWVKNGVILGKGNGQEFSGSDFVNSTWYLSTPKATLQTREMTIAAITVDPNGVYRYSFVYPNDPANYGLHLYNWAAEKEALEQKDKPAAAVALCKPDEITGSIEAVVYGDVYVDMKTGEMSDRPNTMNLACVSGGVGKAGAIFGFLPHVHGIEALEVGTRTVRADYCGDGDSYTKPGNGLYLKDVFGEHDFGQGASNPTEAIWTRKGAACLDTPRDAAFDYYSVDCGSGPLTPCKDADVGSFAGALMHSRAPI